MLPRLRQSFRRWPASFLALALLAFASQGMAATLAWCVHGGADNHVMNAVGPCHDAGGAVADQDRGHGAPAPDHRHDSGADTSDADLGGGGHDGHPGHGAGRHCHGASAHTAHVSAASDAASGAAAALPVPAPALVIWQPPRLVDVPAHLLRGASDSASPAGGDRRPRLSGALPGVSTRLLI